MTQWIFTTDKFGQILIKSLHDQRDLILIIVNPNISKQDQIIMLNLPHYIGLLKDPLQLSRSIVSDNLGS